MKTLTVVGPKQKSAIEEINANGRTMLLSKDRSLTAEFDLSKTIKIWTFSFNLPNTFALNSISLYVDEKNGKATLPIWSSPNCRGYNADLLKAVDEHLAASGIKLEAPKGVANWKGLISFQKKIEFDWTSRAPLPADIRYKIDTGIGTKWDNYHG